MLHVWIYSPDEITLLVLDTAAGRAPGEPNVISVFGAKIQARLNIYFTFLPSDCASSFLLW
jgi:hypothetical protein